ncbi:MAG TPA: hypothetical protein VG245_02590, partial [Candidatus Dormibacteraeota bacterium]|nr:hypothetical protein [Candidatus Dormibacteraeota bacterium]
MTPTLAPAAAPQVRWGMLGKVFLTWLRKNIPSVLVTAVIGAIFGYVSNVWMVSVVYQGTNGVMPGSTAMGPNNIATPAFIWGLGSALLFGVFGYYRGVGGARFWAGVRGLPDTVRGLFTAAGATARAALLWGAAVSLLLSLIVGPAVGALAGLGLFALLTGFAGRLLSGLVARLLRPLLARISPTAPAAATDHAIAVGLLGAALALVVAFMIPPTATTLKLVAAIGCGVAAFFIGGGRRASPPTALMLLLIGILGVEVAQILLHLLHPLVALATDGGQIECQYANKPYWLCEGSATVLAISVGTATASAAGGTGGLFVGQTIAAVTTGFDPQLLS